MTKMQRVRTFFSGLAAFPLAGIMMLDAELGLDISILLLCLALLSTGLRYMFYYIFTARHMVGGKSILYTALIILDLAFFSFTLNDIPKFYLMLYLVGTHAFDGAIKILRGMEAKKLESPSWKFTVVTGGINIAIALCCLVFMMDISIQVAIYSFGLMYNGVFNIYKAFKKSEIVYIQ